MGFGRTGVSTRGTMGKDGRFGLSFGTVYIGLHRIASVCIAFFGSVFSAGFWGGWKVFGIGSPSACGTARCAAARLEWGCFSWGDAPGCYEAASRKRDRDARRLGKVFAHGYVEGRSEGVSNLDNVDTRDIKDER